MGLEGWGPRGGGPGGFRARRAGWSCSFLRGGAGRVGRVRDADCRYAHSTFSLQGWLVWLRDRSRWIRRGTPCWVYVGDKRFALRELELWQVGQIYEFTGVTAKIFKPNDLHGRLEGQRANDA